MNIVSAAPDHVAGIASVHVLSWQQAYAGILDAEYLRGLSVEARTRRWIENLQKAESETCVAIEGEAVVGFVDFGRSRDGGSNEHQGEVWSLYVAPSMWGRGIGRALMKIALKSLVESGFLVASLWVLERNQRAVDFYAAFGFSMCMNSSKWLTIGSARVEEVCMQRRLP